MSIEYTGSPNSSGGTTLSPASGSTGFTSRLLTYGDSVGRLVNASGPTWDSTFNLLGVGTTNPVVHLQLVTTVAGAAAPQMAFQNPQSTVSIGFVGSSDFRIQTTNAVLNIISSSIVIGATTAQKVGFYGVTGVARPSSYTTGASTATRTVPTTVSTAAQTTAEVKDMQNKINDIISVLNNMVGDLKTWGLSG